MQESPVPHLAHSRKIAREAIPRANYKSWSLFLVCKPDWIRPQRSADVKALFV